MTPPLRSFSHVALTVGRGEGPLASRFLDALGFAVTDNGPSLLGDPWYTAVVDEDTYRGGLHQLGFFVVPVSDAQRDLETALEAALEQEREAFLAEKRRKPDSSSHVALHYHSLEGIERAVEALREDDEVSARVAVLTYRPLDGPAWVDDRLDASPVFATATPVRYLTTGVQVFLQTDLVGTGLLPLGQSFELNHELLEEPEPAQQ